MNTAKYVEEITVVDPDSKGEVEVSMFKHNQSGAMFGIDSSYLEQCFDDDVDPTISDPLNQGHRIILFGTR